MKKNIIIIGSRSIGKTTALDLAKKGILSDVIDNNFADLKESKPFLITKLPDISEPLIDPKEPVFNYKKHRQTCDKNRKARKKKKRR